MSGNNQDVPSSYLVKIGTLNFMHEISRSVGERTDLVCKEISRMNPSVFCMQEVMFEPDGSSMLLKNITHETGLNVIAALPQYDVRGETTSGTAILSSLESIESGQFKLGSDIASADHAIYSVFSEINGRLLIVITVHLCWGGENEGERVIQVSTIDRVTKEIVNKYRDRNPVVVLTGDFNALPDGDALRFLKGLGAGVNSNYTHWSDSFDTLGDPKRATTVANDNQWSIATAKNQKIFMPKLLPNRRIDYILTYGWVYGKPGSPVSLTRTFEDDYKYGFTASDHYGLAAEYWMPPV